MRLVDLDPEWVVTGSSPNSLKRDEVLTVKTAQGVLFLDPVELAKNDGPVGTSSVLCWFRNRGVADDEKPGPGRWDVGGTGFADLTLNSSVDCSCGGKNPGAWHGWVKNGEVT